MAWFLFTPPKPELNLTLLKTKPSDLGGCRNKGAAPTPSPGSSPCGSSRQSNLPSMEHSNTDWQSHLAWRYPVALTTHHSLLQLPPLCLLISQNPLLPNVNTVMVSRPLQVSLPAVWNSAPGQQFFQCQCAPLCKVEFKLQTRN